MQYNARILYMPHYMQYGMYQHIPYTAFCKALENLEKEPPTQLRACRSVSDNYHLQSVYDKEKK